jgi:ribosomal protein S18
VSWKKITGLHPNIEKLLYSSTTKDEKINDIPKDKYIDGEDDDDEEFENEEEINEEEDDEGSNDDNAENEGNDEDDEPTEEESEFSSLIREKFEEFMEKKTEGADVSEDEQISLENEFGEIVAKIENSVGRDKDKIDAEIDKAIEAIPQTKEAGKGKAKQEEFEKTIDSFKDELTLEKVDKAIEQLTTYMVERGNVAPENLTGNKSHAMKRLLKEVIENEAMNAEVKIKVLKDAITTGKFKGRDFYIIKAYRLMALKLIKDLMNSEKPAHLPPTPPKGQKPESRRYKKTGKKTS